MASFRSGETNTGRLREGHLTTIVVPKFRQTKAMASMDSIERVY